MRCDQRDLRTVDKWHRFVGDAGTAMPTSCVPKNHCGTHAPGWLESGHPSVEQGAVTGKVCFHWSSKCCHWSVNIKVRNCGDFYVYKLPKTPHCSLRYCVEKKGNVFPACVFVLSGLQVQNQEKFLCCGFLVCHSCCLAFPPRGQILTPLKVVVILQVFQTSILAGSCDQYT